MSLSKCLAAIAALLAVAACGKKDDTVETLKSETSAQAAKVNSASPLEKSFRLKDAEAVNIDAFLDLLPSDVRPSYDDAQFDKKLGATVVTNLRFADAADGEGVVIERAELYGVDLDAIARIKDATSASAQSPFENVFRKVRLFNIRNQSGASADGSLHIGGAEFDKLAIRQGGVEGDGEGDEAARFFNAVNLAGLYLKDASFSVSEQEGASISLSVPDLRFVGLAGGQLSGVIANVLSYEITQSDAALAAMSGAIGPQGAMLMSGPLKNFLGLGNQRTTIQSAAWRSIDLSGLLAWGLKGETPPVTEKNLINLGTLNASMMETYIDGKKAAEIDEAVISVAEFTWLIPSAVRAETKGAVYDFTAYVPDSEAQALAIIKDHGLDKVKGDGFAEWNWNPKSGAAQLQYLANAEDVARLALDLELAGLVLDEFGEAPNAERRDILGEHGALRKMQLTIEDEKAMDAMFALSALQMGGNGDDLRQSAPALLRLSSAQAAQLNPRVGAYVNAVADFIAKSGALEITASPKEPVPFSHLQSGEVDAASLPDVLEVEVKHRSK